MRGHCHDGTGAVAHHDVIGNPDGNPFAIHRIHGRGSGPHAGLVLGQSAIHVGLAGGGFLIGDYDLRLFGGGNFIYQGMLRCQHHVGGSEQGVRPRGENSYAAGVIDLEFHFRAFAAADPIPLPGLDAFRPVQGLQLCRQTVSKCRDPQHPLLHGPPLHGKAADLTLSISDFLIRQNGAEFRTPVDRSLVDIGQADAVGILPGVGGNGFGFLSDAIEPRVVYLQEDPLGPFEVVRVRCVHLPIPVIAKSQRLQLFAEICHILLRGCPRMLASFDGILLSWQAKGIPAHGVQHIETRLFLEPTHDIRGGISFRMPDVQSLATRVGEHVQSVEFWLGGIEILITRTRGAERFLSLPDSLPLGLELVEGKGIATISAHGEGRITVKEGRAACLRPAEMQVQAWKGLFFTELVLKLAPEPIHVLVLDRFRLLFVLLGEQSQLLIEVLAAILLGIRFGGHARGDVHLGGVFRDIGWRLRAAFARFVRVGRAERIHGNGDGLAASAEAAMLRDERLRTVIIGIILGKRTAIHPNFQILADLQVQVSGVNAMAVTDRADLLPTLHHLIHPCLALVQMPVEAVDKNGAAIFFPIGVANNDHIPPAPLVVIRKNHHSISDGVNGISHVGVPATISIPVLPEVPIGPEPPENVIPLGIRLSHSLVKPISEGCLDGISGPGERGPQQCQHGEKGDGVVNPGAWKMTERLHHPLS